MDYERDSTIQLIQIQKIKRKMGQIILAQLHMPPKKYNCEKMAKAMDFKF